MSFARPQTPSGSPKKPLTSTRPSSRASSRPSSPCKPSSQTSLNGPSSRPLSRLASTEIGRPTSRASTLPSDGLTSPTKRPSSSATGSRTPIKPTRPISTSSSNLQAATATGSSSSLNGTRAPTTPARTRERSSDASAVFGAALREEGNEDVPRRRPGFGSFSGPGMALSEASDEEHEGEGELEDEAGKRAKGRGSMVDLAEEGVDPAEAGRETDDGTETETEEEEGSDGKQENVVVCLRVRPPKATPSVSPLDPDIYTLSPQDSTLALTSSHPTLLKRGGRATNPEEYEFRFDLLHIAPHPTVELYDAKIKPVVRSALGGFNGTVFAYGQTASGKTHTMMGSPSEPGIIPLAIDELFSYIHKQNTHRTYSLRVSFLEIYNEHLRDLLVSPTATSNSGSKGPEIVENGLVKNLEERAVSLPSEVLEVLREGEQRRRVGATDWNERSSRSHCVFVVTIESMSKSSGAARTSKLNLIDLAGSESATGQEDRRKEGSFINRSLLTLGTVISRLSTPQASTSTAHIPYRDSKLTRLLQPALSGNSKVAVVCTISPEEGHATESLSTLKFARRAGRVETRAERGVLLTTDLRLKQYAQQVEALQAQIRAVETGEAEKERERLGKRAEEAERKGREAQTALEEKDAELARLRSQLAQTQSLILTGPSLEITARRVSGQQHFDSATELPDLLSPSRSGSRSFGGALGKGRRASEMAGLGLGTPSRSGLGGGNVGGRVPSAMARLAEEDEGREKVCFACSTHLVPVYSSREPYADFSAMVCEQLDTLRTQLDSTTTSLSSAQISLAQRGTELDTLRAQLSQLQRSTSLAQVDAEKSAQSKKDRKAKIGELEREVAEMKEKLEAAENEIERLRKLLGERDTQLVKQAQQSQDLEETVATLERQLSHQSTSHSTALAALQKELDLSSLSSSESASRVSQVEELHALSLRTIEETHRRTLEHEERKTRDVESERDALRRQVERFEALERQRTNYVQAQRQGTDALKSRLAELQARASGSSSSSSSSSSVSSTALNRSTSSASSNSGGSVREEELTLRVQELEERLTREAARGERHMDVREKLELVQKVEEEKRRTEDEGKRGEGWRLKYLAAQKLLDHLTSSSSSTSLNLENRPPLHHSVSTSSDTTPRKLSSSLRGPLKSSQSPSSTRPALPSPQPSSASLTSNHSFNLSSSLSSWNKPTPPPLPYSPQQQSRREEREKRKGRRETIAKDLAKLKGAKVVEGRKGGWDSPGASPVKGGYGEDQMGRVRQAKASWES
ncbi:hypothetical protein JCM11641_007578 [Rhodosporidiobolus odoratus]